MIPTSFQLPRRLCRDGTHKRWFACRTRLHRKRDSKSLSCVHRPYPAVFNSLGVTGSKTHRQINKALRRTNVSGGNSTGCAFCCSRYHRVHQSSFFSQFGITDHLSFQRHKIGSQIISGRHYSLRTDFMYVSAGPTLASISCSSS